MLKRSRTALFGYCAISLAAGAAHAKGYVAEFGTGWQNTGALREALHFEPAIQGSRKDVPAFAGVRLIGQKRFYYSPFVRLNYTNFWSLGGAANTLGVTLAPCAFGVYLTPPPSSIAKGARKGRWFVTLEVALGSLQLGGNLTPEAPVDPRVPDPDAHRAKLRADIQTHGGVKPENGFTQHYPLGKYAFATLGVPIHFRVFTLLTERVGIGGFLESNPILLEWTLESPITGPSSTPAYGYNIVLGPTMLFF